MIYYDKYEENLDFYKQDYTTTLKKKKSTKQKCQECSSFLKRKNQEVCDDCSRKLKYSY